MNRNIAIKPIIVAGKLCYNVIVGNYDSGKVVLDASTPSYPFKHTIDLDDYELEYLGELRNGDILINFRLEHVLSYDILTSIPYEVAELRFHLKPRQPKDCPAPL